MNIVVDTWEDYELIDSGNFEKLERFGLYTLSRPEPQAVWNKSLSDEEWRNKADAMFTLDIKNFNGEKGYWKFNKKIPENWLITYHKLGLQFKLFFNSFKHIGIFPEQAANWDFVNDFFLNTECKNASVLNLFAYTGGASLAACKAGSKTIHVDSVKQVINRANENMQINSLNGVSWIVEDAMTFVKREVKRGKKYNGIILDPPAFGRGPKGEKWVLEKNINELITLCSMLLEQETSFFIINLYSMGLSPVILNNVIQQNFNNVSPQYGELLIKDIYGKSLPLGTYLRFLR